MTSLYGDWQTTPDIITPIQDGVIPRNKYGNVEAPPFVPRLPPGLVHLNHPYIAKTCRSLGVEYASAMVGFERRRGGSVPVLAGVVVCEGDGERVLDAYWEQQRCVWGIVVCVVVVVVVAVVCVVCVVVVFVAHM